MDYAVKRLVPETGAMPVYQLVTGDGSPLLLADQSVSPAADERHQLRLSRPDGRLVATIDLPQVNATQESVEKMADYAIIHEFAVYAILGVRRRVTTDEQRPEETYFTLEVEGEKWIALPDHGVERCYALYDEVPEGLHTYERLTELDLGESIGRICRQEDDATFQVELSPSRLQYTGLVILALTYLIDRSDGNPAKPSAQ